MKRTPSIWCLSSLSILFSLTLGSCKKSTLEASGSGESKAVAPAAPPKPAGVSAHAAKLGFAAHVGKEAEMFVGTVNLKAHLAEAEKSVWWKDLITFMQDKTPKPAGDAKSAEKAAGKIFKEDVFIAMGKGAGESLGKVREFMDLYNEVIYRALMTGGALSGIGGMSPKPDAFLQSIMEDSAMLERAAGLIGQAEIPPLTAGFKTEKPDETLKEIVTDEIIAEMTKKATLSEVNTALGGKFKVLELPLKQVITDEEKEKVLKGIAQRPGVPDPRPAIEKMLGELQKKKIMFAFGTVQGHVVFAAGKDLAHLAFVEKAGDSVLARQEFDFAAPFAEKNMLGLFSVDAAVLKALSTSQPLQPILRGLLSGLKSGEMFKALVAQLEPKVAELATLESKVYDYKHTNAAGLAWWDRGLHMEAQGGIEVSLYDVTKPLKLAATLEQPGTMLGFNYHCGTGTAGREYFEKWMQLIHFSATELVKAGLGGPQASGNLAMVEQMVLPHLLEMYRADKDIHQKALGTESALVVNFGGKLPMLPGVPMPQDGKERKMIRIAGVHDVVDRAVIGQSWDKMNAAIRKMVAAFPSPQPIPVPEVMSSDKNGVTTYFMPIPFASEDLNFYSSVSDRLFLLGTSKALNEEIATVASAPVAAPKTGMHYVINLAAVREVIKNYSALSPDADAKAGVKSAADWLAPFEKLQGSVRKEGGALRQSLSWEIHDVVKFD
jgi:hypothetical protein